MWSCRIFWNRYLSNWN